MTRSKSGRPARSKGSASRSGSLAAADASWIAPAVRRGAPRPGLETGFEQLDAHLGGFRGLAVLGGLRKIGKTTLAQQLICEVVRRNGVPALLVSFEMTTAQLVPVFRACYSGLPRRDVELGALDPGRDEDAWNRWSTALAEFGENVDLRGSEDPFGLDAISAWVRDARDRVPKSEPFVVIDSLHALVQSGASSARSEKESIDRVICDLKGLVGREHCCVLVLSHVTKASRGEAEHGAFLGSSGIEHYADSAWILSGAPNATGKRLTRKLHVIANRFGPPGDVPLDFFPATSRFEERRR